MASLYYSIWCSVPSTIMVKAGVEQKLDFKAPASGVLYREAVEASGNSGKSLPKEQSVYVDFSKPVTVMANQVDRYKLQLKLFGVIPLKDVDVEVIQDIRLKPAGIPIGIYVKTKGVLVNADYQKIFNYVEQNHTPVSTGDTELDAIINNPGILFSVDKYDVDELLFVKFLYRAARTQLKNFYESRMEILQGKIDAATDVNVKKMNENMLSQVQRNKEINNTCFFYCVTLYFAERNLYAETTDGTFDYAKFYGNSSDSYKADIIKYFADNFLEETIEIINVCMGAENNVGNWVRRAGSQTDFMGELMKKVIGTKYSNMFREFVDKYKYVPKV